MWGLVFGLAAALTLAVLMVPVASRSRIPYTVILAFVGVAIGFLFEETGVGEPAAPHAGEGGALPFWSEAFGAVAGLNITSEAVMFLFLPALVFESALSLDLRKLMADISAILFLAVVGVVVSAGIVGAALAEYSGMGLLVCLLLGAIVSATDPVAVIALFKDLGAPKRLTVLVEGESLLNDATAIVLAAIFLGMLTNAAPLDFVDSSLRFLTIFLGGVLVGIIVARPAAWLMGAFKRDALVILTLTLTLPFLAFVIAEHFLHVSGVMAVVAAGLTIGSLGRRLAPPEAFLEVEHAWRQIAFWATSLIFLLVGLAAPRLLGDAPLDYLDDALVLAAAATFGRFLIMYAMVPMLARFGAMEKLSAAYKAIMVWGGLRGAVSLALTLVVLETPGVSEEARNFIGVIVTSFVLFTLFVQATTVRPMMALFGLDKLPPEDRALRDRSVASALQSVQSGLKRFAAIHEVAPEIAREASGRYETAIAEANRRAEQAGDIGAEEWVRIGLAIALAQERQLYLRAFGDGYATTRRLRDALARLDDVIEAAKEPGVAWSDAVARGVAFRRGFRFALALQRRFGVSRPLARALARRLAVLRFMQQALREQRAGALDDIAALLPANARDGFRAHFEARYSTISDNAAALALQYPDYAAALNRRDLDRVALRLEEAAYERLYDQSLIGPEIRQDLLLRVTGAERRAGRLPELPLKVDPQALVARVPFFAALGAARLKRIAKLLKVRFTVPGDVILRKGDLGEEMYFIASGAARVRLETGDVSLGTGDFFGELALITDKPRNADVLSLGYSTLLVLRKGDFRRLLARNPDIRERIRRIAEERLGAGVRLDYALVA